MKKALRLVALLLAFATIAVTLLACGSNDDGKKNPTSGNAVTSDNAGDENAPAIPADFKGDGYEVNFIVGNGNTGEGDDGGTNLHSRSIWVDPDAAAEATNQVPKAVAERNARVESQLDVKIVHKLGVGMQQMNEILGPILLSDGTDYDVVAGYQYFDLGMAYGEAYHGKMLDYSKIDEDEMFIDVTKPYWDKATYDTLAYGGANYWITGDLSQTWVSTMFVSYVNAQMWNTYADEIAKYTGGLTNIYDVVYAGKWTLDLWCQLGNALYVDTNANDKVDLEDQTAFICHSDDINGSSADALVAGSHVTYTKWENGKPQVDLYNSHSDAFMKAVYRLTRESKTCVYPYSGEQFYLDVFTEGRNLMVVGTLAQAESVLSDMEIDFYVVPCPKLNEQQDDYYTSLGDNVSQYGILASCENVGATTATLELMAYYSWKDVTPAYYNDCLKLRYVRGDLDAAGQMIDYIHDRVYSDFVALWSNSCDNITWFYRTNFTQGKRFASNARPKEKAVQGKLDKLLNTLANSIYE